MEVYQKQDQEEIVEKMCIFATKRRTARPVASTVITSAPNATRRGWTYRRPLPGGVVKKSRRNPQQDDGTAVLPYTRSGAPRDGGRRAHQENDKAVMAAYGFKSNMEESEIVAELFRLYEGMVK